MRAWCIEDQQLQLDTLPDLQPGPEEICVQVKAIGVNRADLLQVLGRYPAPPGTDSRIPGLEYAGVVSAVGARVQQRKVGDAVMGLVPGCAYAEQVVTHEREALTVPDGMDFARAVTLPEAFLTAYRALFLEGGLQPGQWCLIRPATAGVGLAATQLAATLGARPIGSSRDLSKLDTATDMGLAAQVCEDDTLKAQLDALTEGQGVAVILDMVGPDWNALLGGLRAGHARHLDVHEHARERVAVARRVRHALHRLHAVLSHVHARQRHDLAEQPRHQPPVHALVVHH